MSSVENLKVKRVSKTSSYVKLGELVPLKTNLDERIHPELVKKYHRITHVNSKQPQATKAGAGLRRVAHQSGTNKGRTRQPYATMGYKSVITNVPNAVKGRKAHRFLKNQVKLKMNKKERSRAIDSLLLMTLKKAKVYVLDLSAFDFQKEKTSKLLSTLRSRTGPELADYLKTPKNKRKERNKLGPCVISKEPLTKLFKNYPNVLYLGVNHRNYPQLFRGHRLRSSVLTDEESMRQFLRTRNFLK